MTRTLFIIALVSVVASGLPSLFLPRKRPWGQWVAAVMMIIGCSAGLASSLLGLFGHVSFSIPFPWPAAGSSFLGMDSLSAFFLVPLFLVGGLGAVFGIGYWPQAKNPKTATRVQFFWGTLVAGIAVLLSAKQGLSFLFGWEMMALSAFFLVDTEDEKAETRKAAWIYIVATHVGTLTLFCLFSFWKHSTGSYDFLPVAPGTLSFGAMNAVFLLTLVGFGLKAGIMPMHFWLPGAHAAAPSHVSAMLSGIMLKTGIYGILRMLSLLPGFPVSWGVVVLLLGAISSVAGILLALGQGDLKKALAYSSVENVGIIVIGLGMAMIGRSSSQPVLVTLGLGGALLHVWNHSLFKPLLFFASGSILHTCGTRRIDLLGGLGKPMPFTAAAFFAGALAISGLPPLNGFVSELFIYLGLLSPISGGARAQAIAAAVPVLSLVGALALACFVRLYGAVFAGLPRTEAAKNAYEGGGAMLVPMVVLAVACALIGFFPGFLSPMLDGVMDVWTHAGASAIDMLPSLASLVPFTALGAFLAILAAALAILVLAARLAADNRQSARRVAGTWDCGYVAPNSRMQYTGSSVTDSLVRLFSAILRPRMRTPSIQSTFPTPSEMSSSVGDPVLDCLLFPLAHGMDRRFAWIRKLQQGVIQNYILYILITVAILLLALLPFGRIFALLASR